MINTLYTLKKEVILTKRVSLLIVIFLSLILLFSVPIMSLATEDLSISYTQDLEISEFFISTSTLTLEIVTPNAEQKIARRGCCSWHGGVCDCIGGRVVCCDGTFSPTCTCHHDTNRDREFGEINF
jgi:hypothetical protein